MTDVSSAAAGPVIGHHAHCIMYATEGWFGDEVRAAPGEIGHRFPVILMMLRFDGTFGFPGGFVDPGEDEATAVAREVKEEMGWDGFEPSRARKVENGLWIYPMTRDELRAVERGATMARDHEGEVLGVVRVPPVGHWYERKHKPKGYSLRNFLGNRFIANSRDQLIGTIREMDWLDPETLKYVLS